MRKSGRIVIYLSAFAIMAMGLLLGGPQEGLGQEEVEVVNEADSPLPVIGDVYVANPPEDPVPYEDFVFDVCGIRQKQNRIAPGLFRYGSENVKGIYLDTLDFLI